MTDIHALRRAFRALHVPGKPLLVPNPWDVGSARLFESLGFVALATTSSGYAASIGRHDGDVDRATAVDGAAALAAAVAVPVSADLENGFGDDLDAVVATVRAAAATGLAGCSIEDYSAEPRHAIYPLELARERVAAAAEAAHRGDTALVLTARAENLIRGVHDLGDTIRRLQAYQEAGADVLYAPGLERIEDVRSVIAEIDRPLNVLARPGLGTIADLAAASVARVSVGGSFAFVAYSAAAQAARELLEHGRMEYFPAAGAGRKLMDGVALPLGADHPA